MKTTLKNFVGTSYQAGEIIGQWILSRPDLLKKSIMPPKSYPQAKLHEIEGLLDRYCKGVNEEIQGFADTLKITREQAVFYAATYLERGCSLMAALPSKTENGHTLLARNYDFNGEMEEMCFAYTAIEGKYRHIGSTLSLFGRCDGMNEFGLAVGIACNGIPVGNFEGGQQAGTTGFSFWVVVRSILEQCKTIDEAIAWTVEAPIGFNINLMLADSQNKIAMLQCMDGHKAFRILEQDSVPNHLSVTNHIVLPEIKKYEKMILNNSVIRYQNIEDLFASDGKISVDEVKGLLSTSYPNGLCCHYYPEFFGTLRSMIFDTNEKKIEMTFGSPQENDWQQFTIQPLPECELATNLPYESADKEFFKIL